MAGASLHLPKQWHRRDLGLCLLGAMRDRAQEPTLAGEECHAPQSLFRGLSALIWIPVIAFIVLVFCLPVLAIQALKKYLGK